ncbi:MAG: response regulator [Planctomycetaceae bacterium]|jgi:CheY-like chemotaxis protein|nr:response regulator [Planctomycetaceae bacterium]
MAYHILLVEDDPDFRLTVKQSLQSAGFAVTESESEQQAYELARRSKFDLAVVDLIMENSDSGFTLCYHFKKDYPDMPLILLSSSTSDMDIEFSMESASERAWIKADTLLNKPIRFEQLLYSVQRLLGCFAPAGH